MVVTGVALSSTLHRHPLVLLLGQNVAKPTYAARDRQDCSEKADGDTSDQSGEEQCEPESQDNWPRCRGWQFYCGHQWLNVSWRQVNYFRAHLQFPSGVRPLSSRDVPALSSNDVNDREYHNPHCIDEVPIKRQDVNSIRVLLLEPPR